MFNAAERAIEPENRVGFDPRVVMLLTPKTFEGRYNDSRKTPLALMLTESMVVLVSRKGFFGQEPRISRWERYSFPRHGVGPRRGTGPGHEVRTDHETEGRLVFVFSTAAEADALGEYFASG